MTLKEAAHLLHRNNRQIVGLGQTVPFNAPPWHAHFAEVEVDTRTGQVTVLRVVAAHDVGRAAVLWLWDCTEERYMVVW